jgi:hypothetical protein
MPRELDLRAGVVARPSSAVTVPSPNLLWNTCMPERRPCEGAVFCGGTGGLAKVLVAAGACVP